MARLYRPVTVRYLDSNGKRCPKATPGARKVKSRSKRRRGEYRDAAGILQTTSLCNDKEASRQMLAEAVRKAQMERAGLLSPFEVHAKRPLAEHLTDFIADLRNRGRTDAHVQLIECRCRSICDACRFKFIGDLSASRVTEALAKLRDGRKLSVQTCNHYLQAMKQFTRWLVRDRRTGVDPVAHLTRSNVRTDVRLERRELTGDELRWFLQTSQNERDRCGLTGWQRHMLYATAVGTGLRASELASLTPESFDLTVNRSTVTIEAGQEKARRGDTLPIPSDLATLLRPWLATIPADAPLWPGLWAVHKQAGKMMRHDLTAARDAWLKAAQTPQECTERERTDSCRTATRTGGRPMFHALRHTYLSRLGRAGVPAKVMQRLARHSTVELTLGRYTHANVHDLAAAVDKLPALPTGPQPEAVVLRATGTDEKPASIRMSSRDDGDSGPRVVAGPIDNRCNQMRTIETTSGETGDSPESQKPLQMQGVESDCESLIGGEAGIRTLERVTPSPVFKTGAIGRSATSPRSSRNCIVLARFRGFQRL